MLSDTLETSLIYSNFKLKEDHSIHYYLNARVPANDHITWKAPLLVRSAQLSHVESG